MLRREFSIITTASAVFAVSGCGTEKHFDLSWNEEVQLHDGNVILVGLAHSYERLRWGFNRYGGTVLARDSTLTFDTGDSRGVVTQLFKGFHPMFIGRYENAWYAVLYGSYYYRSRELPGQDWGELEGPYGQWAIKLSERKWTPISMASLPSVFTEPNMLILKGTVAEHAAFNGERVTLSDKRAWLTKHPLDYGDVRLTRPTAASPQRADSPRSPTSKR